MTQSDFFLSSEEEMRAFGACLAVGLCAGDVVLLDGELGAGKTCLVRAIATALDVTSAVASPTYVIAHEYIGRDFPILHIDAWRLSGSQEFFQLGFDETYDRALTLIEWGDIVQSAFPTALSVRLNHDSDRETGRHIKVTAPETWSMRWLKIENAVKALHRS